MRTLTRLLSRIGEGRAIAGIGVFYVAVAVVWGALQFTRGAPATSLLVLGLLIAVPGLTLTYGGLWLARSEIDPDLHSGIVAWCLIGMTAMGVLLAVYRLQPQDGVSTPGTALLILTGAGAVGGLAVGVYDGEAKMRSRQLDDRGNELREAQSELEETISRLEESNDRLERHTEYTQHVLDGIRDIFYVIEEDGSIKRWNDSLRKVTGYADEQIESMEAAEFFAESERDRIREQIATGFEEGTVQLELPLVTADGEEIPYEFDASTLRAPDGETVLAGIGRDVSERVEREAELEQRARQQQAVADIGQFALEAESLDALLLEASQRVADVLDNDYAKVLDLDDTAGELHLRQGVGWQEGLVGNASVSASEDDSQAAYTLENDRPIVVDDLETEERFGGPDLLREHGVRSGISTVIGPFDEPWGILGTHDTDAKTFSDEDVVFVQSVANILAAAIERDRYQAELEELVSDLEASNERLEQFAYAASHDLQEPLRMVSSYLQLLESRYGDELDEEATEYLEFAVDGADRMRGMIDRLLRYSRVETEGAPLQPVDLDDVLADAREDLQFAIEESDATIDAEALPRVEGDPNQLRQLFQNLLDNAIEYSGEDAPEIRVAAERDGADVIVRVSDGGIGVAPEDQDRIFEVFQRGQGGDETAGSGIGLALCQRIVERHGGEIGVESEPGEGATFCLRLPAADAAGDLDE